MTESMTQVAAALRALESAAGRLAPADVVEAARDPQSPLHSHFEWDDTDAARKYRLDQARTLIRSVKIEVTVREVPLSVVSYVRDPDANTREAGYCSVTQLRSEEDAARAAIVDEMKRVSSAVSRAKALAAVLGVSNEIAQIEAIAKAISDRAAAHAGAFSAAA